MKIVRDHQIEILLVLILGLLVSLPYSLAWLLAPQGFVFSGFLVNPLDGFSYLAKMNQGRAGEWLFTLPYAADPGSPTLLFTFYILLGHLARLLRIPNILVFHTIRLAMMLFMAWAAHKFFKVAIPDRTASRWAFAIFLLSSGLGWLAVFFGWLTTDLLIPESIPFFAAALNPHFPLTYACLALVAVIALRAESSSRAAAFSLMLGIILGAVQPFAAFTLALVLAVWLLWEGWREVGSWNGWRHQPGLIQAASFGLGAAPWLLYDFWLTRNHRVLMAWNAQNQTPSPNPFAYIVGFGLPLLLAAIGFFHKQQSINSMWRLCVVWIVVTAVLLYAPFNLQRRLSLGVFLPIAAMAGWGAKSITSGFRKRQWLPYLLLALALPSNLLAMAAGLGLVADGSELLLLTAGERAGYQWIAENVAQDSLVLAAPTTGNRLPAFAPVRVIYGHPFETPEAEENSNRVVDLLQLVAAGKGVEGQVAELGITHLVFGPHEADITNTDPEVLPGWRLLFASDDFRVFAAVSP